MTRSTVQLGHYQSQDTFHHQSNVSDSKWPHLDNEYCNNSPISIQLKLINEYDPIFMLLAIKASLKLKVFTFSLKYQKLTGKYKLSAAQAD